MIRTRLRNKSSSNRAVPFPSGIPNLLAWYDSSDLATITDAGGGAVSAWADKSGNGYNLTQGTGGNRPVTGSVTISGKNAINFLGDDFMSALTVGGSGGYRGANFTILSVWQNNIPATTDDYWIFSGNSAALGVVFIGASDTFNGHRRTAGDLSTPSTFAVTPDSLPHIVGQRIATNSTQQIIYDGAFGATNTATAIAGTDFLLGAYNSFGGFMNARMGEIVAYSRALSDGEVGEVCAYLESKWGVA